MNRRYEWWNYWFEEAYYKVINCKLNIIYVFVKVNKVRKWLRNE